MEAMQQMLARGARAGACQPAVSHQTVLLAPEAEQLIQNLRKFSVPDVGTQPWFQQQAWTEKLNLQSHANAMAHTADFVQEYFVSHDQVTTLVHELLVMEVWKEKLFPLLDQHLSQHVDSVSAYMLLFYEATIANLLEMVLFVDQAFETLADEYALELVDWCSRQLTYCHGPAFQDAKPLKLSCKEMVDRSELDLLYDRMKELRFGVAMCSITILRYLSGAAGRLHICVVTRIIQHHDFIEMLVPLLENPPWVRDRDGTREIRDGTHWKAVSASDRFQLTKIDAQVWLALNNLAVDPHFRAKYQLESFRKTTLSRVKRFLNDLLIDQLPVLKDLQRVVDEVTLNYTPNFESHPTGALVIEQMPQVRVGLLQQDWDILAADTMSGHLSQKNLAKAAEDRIGSMLAALDFMADCEQSAVSNESNPEPEFADLTVNVNVYEKTATGVMAAWSNFELGIDATKKPVRVSIKGESGGTVLGERWTLKPPCMDGKVLPTDGRIAVCFNGNSAQALLRLPCSTSKDQNEIASMPQGLWVTVGLLAQDKLALQLRLKRKNGCRERNAEAGIYYLYSPVGGALTILTESIAGKENEQPWPKRVIMELE